MAKSILKDIWRRWWLCLWIVLPFPSGALAQSEPQSVREIVASAILAGIPAEQRDLVLSLKQRASPEVVRWLEKWKEGAIFLHKDAVDGVTPVILAGEPNADDSFAALKLTDGSPMRAADGTPVRLNPKEVDFAETDTGLRRAMKEISDLAALANPDAIKRIRAIQDSAIGQKQEKLPALKLLRTTEKDAKATQALDESIAIIQLRSSIAEERVAACETLGRLNSLAAHDTIQTILNEALAAKDQATAAAATQAIASIDRHISRINAVGTAFRGISLGSVLPVVAIGGIGFST